MVYQLEGNAFLFEIDRSKIIDISAGDSLEIKGLPDLQYTWTLQDSEFVENNPDDDIFISVERTKENNFKAIGIRLRNPMQEVRR
jgi:hypothetical protein